MARLDTSAAVELPAVADVAIPGSFDAYYRSEFSRMVNIAYALSGSRLAAEDLAQDAMVARNGRGTGLEPWINPVRGRGGSLSTMPHRYISGAWLS
jgi:hypothetical protein